MAKEWSKTPSELLFIEDTFLAYCFNEAIFAFGVAIESHISGLKKSKTQSQDSFERMKARELRRLLEVEQEEKFANPMPGARKG